MRQSSIRIESRPGGCPCARQGLGALGEGNFLDSLTSHLSTAWNDITGATANKRAQESALALQQVAAQRAVAEAQARAQTLQAIVPWVAGGVVVLIGGLVLVKVIK